MNQIIRKHFLPIVCPSSLFAIVNQALFVIIPLYVLELGGSFALSAGIVGLKGLGMMLADLPAGLLLSRFSDKRIMMLSALFTLMCILLMALVPVLSVVLVASFALGIAHGSWLVGRISYVTEVTEVHERGRVMALTAGTIRLGSMIGPAAAGILISTVGYSYTLLSCVALLILVVLAVLTWIKANHPKPHDNQSISSIIDTLKDHRKSFLTAGIGSVALMLLRASRALLIPLIGAAILLDATSIGLAVSIGALVDTLLFYPAGSMMDRIGRKPVLIASLITIAVGIFSLPFVDGYLGLVMLAVLMGAGNGISAGVVMTMGSDLAPTANRGNFIGVWRLLSDVGVTSGPLIIGGVVQLSGLAVASHLIGVMGIFGAVYVAFSVTETLHQRGE